MVENSENDVESFLAFTLEEGSVVVKDGDHQQDTLDLTTPTMMMMMTDEDWISSTSLDAHDVTAAVFDETAYDTINDTTNHKNKNKEEEAMTANNVVKLSTNANDKPNVLTAVSSSLDDDADKATPEDLNEYSIMEDHDVEMIYGDDLVDDVMVGQEVEVDNTKDENSENRDIPSIGIPFGSTDSISAQAKPSDESGPEDDALALEQGDCNDMEIDDIYNKEDPARNANNGIAHTENSTSIDLEKVCALLEENRTAGDCIEGKDIVLLIGSTGAGKTTTLLYLAGTKFEETEVDGFDHYEAIEFPNDKLRDFNTSCGVFSGTKTIQVASVAYGQGESVILCDCPGFGDTEGVEMDIANGIGLIEALHRAKTVKPVLVLSASGMEDRFRSLTATMDTVTRMMGNNTANFSAFSYVFTRCDDRLSKKIHRRLVGLRARDSTDHENDALNALLDDMISKCARKTLYVSPIEDEDRLELLRDLLEDSSPCIAAPKNTFRTFASKAACDELQVELYRIMEELEQRLARTELELACSCLRILNRMGSLISEAQEIQKLANFKVGIYLDDKRDSFRIRFSSLGRYDNTMQEDFRRDVDTLKLEVLSFLKDSQSLIEAASIDRGENNAFVLEAIKVLVDTLSKGSLKLLKESCKDERIIEQERIMQWLLQRLKYISDSFSPIDDLFTFKCGISMVVDTVNMVIDGALIVAEEKLATSTTNIGMVDGCTTFAWRMERFYLSEQLYPSSEEIPFADRLERLINNLEMRLGSSKRGIEKVMVRLHKLTESSKRASDQSNKPFLEILEVEAHRAFLMEMVKSKIFHSVEVWNLKADDIRHILKQFDDMLEKYLNSSIDAFETTLQSLSAVDDSITELEERHNAAGNLLQKISEASILCRKAIEWPEFPRESSIRCSERLAVTHSSVNDFIGILDSEVSEHIKTLNDTFKVVQDILRRLRSGNESHASILVEIADQYNWNHWTGVVRNSKSGFGWKIVNGFKKLLGVKSIVNDLETVLNEVVEILHDSLSRAMQSLEIVYDWHEREVEPSLLEVAMNNLHIWLAYMQLSSDSELALSIAQRRNDFSKQVSTSVDCVSKLIHHLRSVPVECLRNYRFRQASKILQLWSASTALWTQLRAFVAKAPRHVPARPQVRLDFLRKNILEISTLDSLRHEAMEMVERLMIDVKGISYSAAHDLHNDTERKVFYNKMARFLQSSKEVQFLKATVPQLSADATSNLYAVAYEKVQSEIKIIIVKLADALATFPDEEAKFSAIYMLVANLSTIALEFQGIGQQRLSREAEQARSEAHEIMKHNLKVTYDNILSLGSGDLAKVLIRLKKASRELFCWKSDVDKSIDSILLAWSRRGTDSAHALLELSSILRKLQGDDGCLAQQLLSDHDCFEGIVNVLFNEATSGQGIDYVLKGLKSSSETRKLFEEMYVSFETIYSSLITDGIAAVRANQLTMFMSDLGEKTHKVATDCSTSYCDQVSSLTAHVFAYWSWSKSNSFVSLSMKDPSGKSSKYLMRPHAAQVVSIWLMLNCHSCVAGDQRPLANQLIEIRTGEGKSVVLGVTAVVLGLFGYDVDCICYSSYLSGRDYSDFEQMFRDFGISQKVWYGTLKTAMKIRIVDKYYELANSFFELRGYDNAVDEKERSRRVLLFDEVDVLFDEKIIGSTAGMCASLSSSRIRDLFSYVWENSSCKVTDLLATDLCGKVLADFPEDLHDLLKHELKEIKKNSTRVVEAESTEYIVSGGRLGLKYFDGIDFHRCCYSKSFEAIKAFEQGRITRDERNNCLAFFPMIAILSNANIPLHYDVILGVTGTLRSLGAAERGVLATRYDIQNYHYVPSVYGGTKLKFAGDTEDDVILCDSEDDHFLEIKQEIIRRRSVKVIYGEVKRAVMVFFESSEKLLRFLESSVMKSLKKSTRAIDETVLESDKNGMFLKATEEGAITLMIREFGRGTDFKCFDERMLAAGGVHVIQTFVSIEISEEIQIKGRSARQGANGSYSMVLDTRDLCHVLYMTDENIRTMKNERRLYSMLDEFRSLRAGSKMDERLLRIESYEENHYRSIACYEAMKKGPSERGKVISFFAELSGLSTPEKAFESDVGKMKESILKSRKDRLRKKTNFENERRQRMSSVNKLEASALQKELTRIRELFQSDKVTHYDLLGVRRVAASRDIAKAYRQLCKIIHPDKCNAKDAKEIIQKINEANAVLSCAEKRATYDADLILKESESM